MLSINRGFFVLTTRTATRHGTQVIVTIYEASPTLPSAPEVHQNAFLYTVADYTYAGFIHVIVSGPFKLLHKVRNTLD